MLKSLSLFGNLFRSSKITPDRLYSFGIVALQAFILGNDAGQFDALISLLTPILATLKNEISDIDSNLTDQKTETKLVSDFIVGFYTFMSDNESIIAKQLGGRGSAGYKAFFPFGKSEYSKATRTVMPMLTSRVAKAAKKYGEGLTPDLVEELEGFDSDYQKQYSSQQTQKHIVKQERNQLTSVVLQTQMALITAVHTVGALYPADVDKCDAFFPFTMLYPQTKTNTEIIDGKLEKSAVANLLNRTLTKNVTITATNTGDNAAFAVWAASNATSPMPEDAYVVNAAAPPVTILASSLGDLQVNTFIMIKNLSDVNSCQFELAFTGLKKQIDKPVSAEDMEVLNEDVI